VTNVLYNRTGYYSEDTRDRVLRAIAELNYQPHRAARSLRSQRTMQLGFHTAAEQLAPDNAFVLNFIQDLVRAAAQRGHHILVFTENGDELEAFGKLVAMHGVDGFILSGSRVDDPGSSSWAWVATSGSRCELVALYEVRLLTRIDRCCGRLVPRRPGAGRSWWTGDRG